MLKTRRTPGDPSITIELIGHIGAEILPELKAQIDAAGRDLVLDMSEVTLVDLEAVRLLVDCQARGIQLRGCSAYIREWIAREKETQT